MAKSKGISKLFLSLTASFIQSYEESALELSSIIMFAKRDIKRQLNERAAELLVPIIDDYFKEGIAASNQIVKSNISRLADDINIPFKYNKDLILTYNTDKSIFTGYYDKQTKSLFARGEIDKLKRTILSGKYGNWTDDEMVTAIRKTVNTTKNRALVIARQETARLDTAAKQIYYNNNRVKKEYELKWVARSDARPTHKEYDGKIADEDGYFDGPEGRVTGPPIGWSCRCRIELVRKSTL